MAMLSTILPDDRFSELGVSLRERLNRQAERLRTERAAVIIDPLMGEVLRQGFTEAEASEGTVWLLHESGEFLVPVFNTGPNEARFVGKFRQPLSSGLICMVFASEQPFLENDLHKNSQQSKLLDRTLGVETYGLIAVPFYFFSACRGVISCVQLARPDHQNDPSGFNSRDLSVVQRVATVLSRLVEYHLITQTIGWGTA